VDKFVTGYFAVLFTILICVGLDPSQKTAAVTCGIMVLGIFFILPAAEFVVETSRRYKKFKEVTGYNITAYSDWK
jgi:hypothetical protein